MLRIIKQFVCAVFLMAGLQGAFGFALLGPLPPDAGGETWQVITIGYALPYAESALIPGAPVFLGDIGGPHNYNEEYRRVTPVMYYAYNSSFLTYFGLAGATNADLAFGIMNAITNVSTYSPGLTEFPLDSQSYNLTAQAMYLLDLKSVTLHLLVEQLGLAQPERYTWTLHDRFVGPACPLTTSYTVVQRNFDIVNSPLTQLQPTAYVNNVLYYYYIAEICSGTPPLAQTVPFSVDPLAKQYTAVAANDNDVFGGLQIGGFYTGLTRDDVGGLRYLLYSNNIEYESTVLAGGQVITTNVQPPQLFGPTLPFSLLFSEALTNAPDVLGTNFPGIAFISVQTNIINFITTNTSAFFTNQSVPPVFSNTVAGGLTNGFYFTNQPGPTVINYDPTTFIQLQTLDLGIFADQSVTDAPAILQALYPGLEILSVVANPKLMYVTNFVNYLTNLTGAPFQGAPVPKTVISSITSFFGTNYVYTFGNVFTNHSSTNRIIVTQNIWITNLTGAPFGSPFVAYTNYVKTTNHMISGDFFIIPTNWCGFEVLGVSPVNILPPYATGPTNTIVFGGFNTNGAVGTNFAIGGNSFGLIQNSYDIYTNYNIVLRPGICEPVLAFGTTTTTNTINTYTYVFANVVTNHYFTNSLVTIITTNIAPCPGGSTTTLCTNITSSTFYTNIPSGDFYIVPPNLCNFSILSTQSSAIVFTTNTFTATNGIGVTNAGQQFTVTIITSYTNYTFKVLESTCTEAPAPPGLREGIEHVQFIREDYDSLIGQFIAPVTNYYTMILVTNGQPVTESYQRIITQPDIVFNAADLAVGPAGNNFNGSVERNITFDSSQVQTGHRGPGVIYGRTTFTYNEVGPIYEDLDFLGANTGFIDQVNLINTTQFGTIPGNQWASFDASTNAPILYPNGTSLQDLANSIFLQVSPTTVPNGTVGTAYPSIIFTATGGQPGYTWAAPNLSALVPGLSFNASTATLSGTPTTPGTFSFVIQVTDSVNRVVNLNYTIIIQ